MSEEKNTGLDLRQAVTTAINAVRSLYAAQNYELTDVLLEEIEKQGDVWNVTVGFTRPVTATSELGAIGQTLANKRAFKRVRIDARTGEFLGMEIRELQSTSSPSR